MNKLDTLKKQWKNQKFAKNFSKEELFHLTQKKSISSIKWIFIKLIPINIFARDAIKVLIDFRLFDF